MRSNGVKWGQMGSKITFVEVFFDFWPDAWRFSLWLLNLNIRLTCSKIRNELLRNYYDSWHVTFWWRHILIVQASKQWFQICFIFLVRYNIMNWASRQFFLKFRGHMGSFFQIKLTLSSFFVWTNLWGPIKLTQFKPSWSFIVSETYKIFASGAKTIKNPSKA